MIHSPITAALFALFFWWFATGAILFVVQRADRAGRTAARDTVIWGLPFLAFGLAAAWASRTDGSVVGLYLGFSAALALWGWIELAFLCGVITGPSSRPEPAGATPRQRLLRAWEVVAYHEAALVLGLLILIGISLGQPNWVAAMTYAVLYVARVLAKLNLFLGVPGINVEVVPSTLAHIPSYFRKREPSWLFPLSVTLLSMLAAIWIERLAVATTPEAAVTFALLAAITALALLEHWMMLIPLADTKLWRWLIPAPKTE